jgi:hypothetical protein
MDSIHCIEITYIDYTKHKYVDTTHSIAGS